MGNKTELWCAALSGFCLQDRAGWCGDQPKNGSEIESVPCKNGEADVKERLSWVCTGGETVAFQNTVSRHEAIIPLPSGKKHHIGIDSGARVDYFTSESTLTKIRKAFGKIA